MPDGPYAPLDLSAHCNAGREALAAGEAPPVGAQQFHGLPFQIGSPAGQGQCFLLLGPGDAAVRLPVGRPLRHLIFAHRQLESQLLDGGPMGELVAEYVVCYADGEEEHLPIRERLEIAVVPTVWGQWPLLAWPEHPNALLPRYHGDWDYAGLRQTEALQGMASAYYLWPWANPRPDCPVAAIMVVPRHRRFLLAAVTLGQADETPFARAGKREVLITLPQQQDAARPFALAVQVDRGVATYPYALPAAPAAAFLADQMRGWGETPNEAGSPAYVEVAATPSATVTVTLGEERLGSLRWGDLEAQGALDPSPRLRVELIDRGRNWVRTTIVDDADGQPIPCRVHFRSPEGVPYAPHGHHAHINSNNKTWHIDVGGDVRLGQLSYAYIDGS